MISCLRRRFSLVSLYCLNPKNATFSPYSSLQPLESKTQPPKSNSIADYLITSCGFSPQKAATISNYSAHRRFPSNAESVRHFFKHHGFTDKDIRSVISSAAATILWADVDKTLQPNLDKLRELVNFSDSELRRFIISNPRVLTSPSAFSRLEFWKAFLNNDMKKLLLVFIRNRSLIGRDIDNSIAPKIALLKKYGLSQADIGMLLGRGSGFIQRSIASIEISLKKVQELGFPLGSPMFVLALSSIGSASPDLFEAKMELFKCLGWSEDMFLAAIKKCPIVVLLSERNIREKVEFFVGKAGFSHDYIALHPTILGYSLEKRVVPRHQVWKVLSSDEAVGSVWGLYSIICLTEKMFLEKIVHRYKDLVPNLYETYISAFADTGK